jgi:hypothetical protein
VTLWELLSAISLLTPVFAGFVEGKSSGGEGVVIGLMVGTAVSAMWFVGLRWITLRVASQRATQTNAFLGMMLLLTMGGLCLAVTMAAACITHLITIHFLP